jgi:hypothetical protein
MFKSIEEARIKIEEMTVAVLKIEMQLGDPCRNDQDGVKLSTSDYMKWRKKAKTALFYMNIKIREAFVWIDQQKDKMLTHSAGELLEVDCNNPISILTAAYKTFKRHADELTSNDLLLVDVIERHLEKSEIV